MTYNLKKDYVKNPTNGRMMVNIENNDDDDDQDIYISERSSIASSNDMNPTVNPPTKRIPTPTTSSMLIIPQKQLHTHRYPYNEIPENVLPITTQLRVGRKEENKKKKNTRKNPTGQRKYVSFYGTKAADLSDHHYPSWYSNKINNPDWSPRHRQQIDNQIISHESFDSSQNTHQPVLTTLPLKPRQHPTRNIRHNHHQQQQTISHDKQQRFDHSENTSVVSSHGTSPIQYVSFKDSDYDEHRIQPNKQIISRQRRKLKTEHDWTEHYLQSISNGKPSPESSSLIITSNSLANRSKNRTKLSDKNSVVTDPDEHNKYYRSQHSHHHYSYQNQSHNSPSIPSQQIHNHQPHLHIRRRPPSGAYLASDIHVVDVTFKRTDRPSLIQPTRDPYPTPVPPPSNHQQTPYFPPITRDHHQPKTHTPRFPNEYYGTLARQTNGKDWEEPLEIPRLYKPDSQARFYDRYIHNVVDKRLAV